MEGTFEHGHVDKTTKEDKSRAPRKLSEVTKAETSIEDKTVRFCEAARKHLPNVEQALLGACLGSVVGYMAHYNVPFFAMISSVLLKQLMDQEDEDFVEASAQIHLPFERTKPFEFIESLSVKVNFCSSNLSLTVGFAGGLVLTKLFLSRK